MRTYKDRNSVANQSCLAAHRRIACCLPLIVQQSMSAADAVILRPCAGKSLLHFITLQWTVLYSSYIFSSTGSCCVFHKNRTARMAQSA
jgi:hypothetical protein